MIMRILFFAQLKDGAGCSSFELPAPVPMNAEQLWIALLKQFPALADHRPAVRLAKNSEYVGPEAMFADGDEVALIPPVSGG
jgi:molybdopterin converting factor subunit 1